MTEIDSTVAAHGGDVLTDGGAVRLDVPSDVAYVGVVRAVAATLAARCDLTIDEIEDVRIAVDEACALLVPQAVPGSALSARFTVAPAHFGLAVTVAASSPGDVEETLDRDGFAWTVLEALADTVGTLADADRLGIELTKSRDAAATNGA